jgi:hypothetical protein
MSHEPEPWQTNATAPFLSIEKASGTVSVWSLGKERFRVEAPGHDSEVEGYDEARVARARRSVRTDCERWPSARTASCTSPAGREAQ